MKTAHPRYRVTADDAHSCTLEFLHGDRKGEQMRFHARYDGGYIRFYRETTGAWEQICEGLSSLGSTLHYGGPGYEDVAAIIRREARVGLADYSGHDKTPEEVQWEKDYFAGKIPGTIYYREEEV